MITLLALILYYAAKVAIAGFFLFLAFTIITTAIEKHKRNKELKKKNDR